MEKPIKPDLKQEQYERLYQQGADDGFDPYEHREVEKGSTNMETMMNLLKGCVGTGVLAMHEAFRNSGLWCGFVSTFFIGVLVTFGIQTLYSSQYALCKRMKIGYLTYPQAVKSALLCGPQWMRRFANSAALLSDIFIVTFQIGVGPVYILFVAYNIKDIVDLYLPSAQPVAVYMAALFLPFVAMNMIRNLKLIAPFSMISNIFVLVSFAFVMYYVLKDGLQDLSEVPAFGTLLGYPLYFGTTMFALEPVGVFISIEKDSKTPRDYTKRFGVYNMGMAIVTLWYAVVGLLGYWKYANSPTGIQDVITLQEDVREHLVKALRILYAVSIYISYSLQMYPAVDIVWNNYLMYKIKDSPNLLLWEYFFRVGIVVMTFVLAVTVPLLGLFISLLGSVQLASLGFVFPGIMDICVHWPDMGTGNWILVKDLTLILLGLVGLASGSYSAISEIVRKL